MRLGPLVGSRSPGPMRISITFHCLPTLPDFRSGEDPSGEVLLDAILPSASPPLPGSRQRIVRTHSRGRGRALVAGAGSKPWRPDCSVVTFDRLRYLFSCLGHRPAASSDRLESLFSPGWALVATASTPSGTLLADRRYSETRIWCVFATPLHSRPPAEEMCGPDLSPERIHPVSEQQLNGLRA